MRVLVVAAVLVIAGPGMSGQVVMGSVSGGIGMVAGSSESFAADMPMRNLRGQPYVLVQKTTTVRTLADGTTITIVREERHYRDSEGRTRTENKQTSPKTMFDMGMVVLFDPVAQTNTVIQESQKEARVMHFQAPKPPTPEQQARLAEMRAKARAARATTAVTPGTEQPKRLIETEKLEPRNIDGVVVEGSRMVRTIPAGTEGNDRDLKTVMESWRSSELGMVMESTMDDPRTGKTTTEVVSFERTEPDAGLFRVPEGYKVIEQKQGAVE